jgi:hypothetical protein
MGVLVLLLLDLGQHFAETLVLDDGRVTDALQMVEDGVGHSREDCAQRRGRLLRDYRQVSP